MSISINNNNGIIEVSQDGNVPRSYFRTSGKFYPSGATQIVISNVPGTLDNLLGFKLISNTLKDLVEGLYEFVPSTTNSNYPSLQFKIYVDVDGNIYQIIVYPINTYGYSIGDSVTIQGSNLGGSGSLTYEVTRLETDGFLINIDNDVYNVRWYDLIINGSEPSGLIDAANQLSFLFSTI